MDLEKLIPYATIFSATPEDLEKSSLPDSLSFQVCMYGLIDNKEIFLDIFSGPPKGSRSPYPSYLLVSPDTSNDWSESIPLLGKKLAEETGGRLRGDESSIVAQVILSEKPTQVKTAQWVRAWSSYFDEQRLSIDRIRYSQLTPSLLNASPWQGRFRLNTL